MAKQIDLDPHEYRTPGERRKWTFGLLLMMALLLLGLYVTNMLLDWRGWAIAFFGFGFGWMLILRFPKFFLSRITD